MRYECPECEAPTRKDKGRKYLPGTVREKRHSLLVDMRHRVCPKKKCGHAFIIRTEYPLDTSLEPSQETSYNWAEYNNALKMKPGIPVGGTTVSDYTQEIHHDTASVWWRVLGYEKPPEIKRMAMA